MYSKPDYTTFTVDGWKSLLVFILLLKSYCRKHNARDETMMTAQNLLGKINATKNTVFYCIYQLQENAGFWSSRAPTATTVVLPELMPKELVKSMMDVVSHEFFHIVTPLIQKKSKI
jgi:hypothetical protein